jgi:hypothetical protein
MAGELSGKEIKMSIVNECMIVNCQIGVWSGHRLDKEASLRVTQEAQAADDAARVNKHLVSKEALKAVQQAATQVRQHFYRKTLPWKDNGDRLLTRKMYVPYMQEHAALRYTFEQEVKKFLEDGYPAAFEKARFRMGALFNPNDYPSEASLRRRFYVNLDIDPVSTANDFRVTFDEGQEAEIKQEIEEAMARRVNDAMADVWSRLHTTLSNYQERMASKDGRFKEATIDNLQEIVDMLPAFNVLGDPQLEKIAKDVQGTLLGTSAKELRKDDKVRSAAAMEAQRILEDMAGFMNAFRKDDE